MAGLLRKFFLIFLMAFLLGIFLGEMFKEREFLKILVVIFLMVMGFRTLILKNLTEGETVKFLCAFLLIFGFGIFRFFWSFALDEDDIRNFSGEIILHGCVADEVDVREDKVKYVVEVSEVQAAGDALGEFLKASGKVLVNGPRYPLYEYCDCLEISGNLEVPGVIAVEAGFSDFDYGKYLARFDIYRVIFRAEILPWSDAEFSDGDGLGERGFFYYLYKLKGDFSRRISRLFGEPYGSLMQGLLLGSRRGIDPELMDKFNVTGLTHIIAISGWNITMVILVMGFLFKFLSRRVKVLASVAGVVLFVLFVGASASVVRAAFMGVISLFAVMVGRQYFVELALFLAAVLMNLWNPKVLVYDVSFQLSVLATMGLVYFGPIVKAFIDRLGGFVARILPERFAIRESFCMSLSAQICALPIILINFGRLSLISLVANIFVLPLIPLVMLFGFLAVLASYVADFIGIFVGFFAYALLWLVIFLVEFFAAIPFASINIGWMSFYLAVLWYFLLFLWLRRGG